MMKAVTYADAGVNIDAANRATEKIKELARSTFNARTLSEIGSFGGMFDGAFPQMRAPVLVASADGVGTKLKVAFALNTHDTVGRRSEEHTSELQSQSNLVCRLLLEKKKKEKVTIILRA